MENFWKKMPYKELRVSANHSGSMSVTGWGRLSSQALEQLCQIVDVPESYLHGLPPTLMAQNLNHGLKTRDQKDMALLLFHKGGLMILEWKDEEAMP